MERMNLEELAALARAAGYDKERCIERMIWRIERGYSFLLSQHDRGQWTAYDEFLTEDAPVAALVIFLLQGRGCDE